MEHLALPPSARNAARTSGILTAEQILNRTDLSTGKRGRDLNANEREAIRIPCIEYIARSDYRGVPFRQYFDRFQSTYAADEGDAFMQTWLFFCLLQNMLGGRFRHSDFVRPRTAKDGLLIAFRVKAKAKPQQSATVLTTAKLNKLLQGLDKDIKKAKKRNNTAYLSNLERLYYDADICFQQRRFVRTGTPIEVMELYWSIPLLLKEALWSNGVRLLFGHVTPLSPDFPDTDFWDTDFWKQSWCPADASRAWTQLPSFAARYYWLNMKLPKRLGEDHTSCRQTNCRLAQIDPKSYKLQHARPGCTCPQLVIDRDVLIGLLEKTPRAVLRVPNKADWYMREVSLVELIPGMQYITLSHVWADGMGNPHANALHSCMIEKFIDLCRPVYQSVCGKDLPYMYVWCDTLCIPTGNPDVKPKVLKEMRSICSLSAVTLVVDSMLDQHQLSPNFDYTLVEAACLIILSRWMSRLWTLQEAMLSRNLWFNFNGGSTNLDSIRSSLWEIMAKCASQRKASLALICVDALHSLRVFNRGLQSDRRGALSLLQSQLRTRSLSNDGDEPICLSNILDAMLDKVRFPPCLAMAEFWKACADLGMLDSLTIFHYHGTLDQPGFRWAPHSLLGSLTGTEWLDPVALNHTPGPREPRLVPQGLMQRMPALMISAGPGLDMTYLLLSAGFTGQAFHLLDGAGQCWSVNIRQCMAEIATAARKDPPPMRKMAILLNSTLDLQNATNSQATFAFGVLAAVTEEHEHYTAVRRVGLCRVTSAGLSYRPTRRLPPFDLHGFQGAKDESCGEWPFGLICYGAAKCTPRIYVTELLPESHRWIID